MKRLLLCLFSFITYTFCNAQLSVTNGSTPTALVNTLLGAGVAASNISFQGVYGMGSKYQAGSFTASGSVSTNLGFSSGIILSSGHTSDIPLSMSTFPGNNNYTSSGLTSTCANNEIRQVGSCGVYINDLDVLAGSQNYYNAAVLEFDFVPNNTNIVFNYVFGSEEYDQNDGSSIPINYNCSSYNDKFGFIISGPGIAGGQGYSNNGKNIARLSNGAEVSINSVNDGTVGTYGGSPSASNCIAANSTWQNGLPTTEFKGPIYGIQFNGNTKVLTAGQSGLTVGATYHIKLIVTDVNDGAYDSGVFLQAASFTSPSILPIELISFDAKCEEDYTELNWQTASEMNNDYFIIERANEELRFEEIARIKGAGNSKEVKNYTYKDYGSKGTNYYQLVQVDNDGTKTNSKLIITKNTCKSDYSIDNFFYDENTNEIIARFNSLLNQSVNIDFYDILGRKTISSSKEFSEGNNELKLSMNGLKNDVYFCVITNGKSTISKKIFVHSK